MFPPRWCWSSARDLVLCAGSCIAMMRTRMVWRRGYVKIAGIETFVLRIPIGEKRFFSSQAPFPERNSLLVKITTDTGLVGWGEAGQYGPGEPPASGINDVFRPPLLGQPADEPVRIAEELYAFSRDFGQCGTYVEAISG